MPAVPTPPANQPLSSMPLNSPTSPTPGYKIAQTPTKSTIVIISSSGGDANASYHPLSHFSAVSWDADDDAPVAELVTMPPRETRHWGLLGAGTPSSNSPIVAAFDSELSSSSTTSSAITRASHRNPRFPSSTVGEQQDSIRASASAVLRQGTPLFLASAKAAALTTPNDSTNQSDQPSHRFHPNHHQRQHRHPLVLQMEPRHRLPAVETKPGDGSREMNDRNNNRSRNSASQTDCRDNAAKVPEPTAVKPANMSAPASKTATTVGQKPPVIGQPQKKPAPPVTASKVTAKIKAMKMREAAKQADDQQQQQQLSVPPTTSPCVVDVNTVPATTERTTAIGQQSIVASGRPPLQQASVTSLRRVMLHGRT